MASKWIAGFGRLSVAIGVSLLMLFPALCMAQNAELTTRDTQIVIEAAPDAPRLVSLQISGHAKWQSQSSESLIKSVEIKGEQKLVQWHLNSSASRADDRTVSFVYESSDPHLRLTWSWIAKENYGPIEHQIRIANLSTQELWLPIQDSLVFEWQIPIEQKLEHMFVEKGAGKPSAIGTHVVSVDGGYSWTGRASTYGDIDETKPREIIPFTLVQDSASQSGWYLGIEFSGRTRVSLARTGSSLRGAAGLDPDPAPFRTRLEPGESFETPVVFLGGFERGIDGAGNALRRWVRAALGNAATWNDPKYPLVVNNSWGGGMNVNEEIARRMIADAANLGMEMFHLDAGWFRAVGDWRPDPQKFPHGLSAIADDAHQHGLKFGLWVDWTQAGLSTAPGALNARDPKVRDWMVTDLPKDWQPEEFKGQTIDIGVPEAKEWAQHEVERIVSDYNLDMLEHDGYLVAHGCDRTDHPHAPPDPLNKCIYRSSGAYWVDSSNSTDVSYHAVRAYYDIYAKLRREHPGLMFEICADGGRMVDFGTAAHGDYFSITDSYDPLSNRRAFYDTSHALPAAMLESYVEKWPVPRIENFRYMLRSGMMGWLSVMMDTTSWSGEQHEEARKEIELYKKELRPLIRDADLYHVSPRPDGVHWDGVEYWDPSRRKGVLYAFHGTDANDGTHSFVLKGLNPSATYKLSFNDHTSADRTGTGRELMRSGVKVYLPVENSSELVFIAEKN